MKKTQVKDSLRNIKKNIMSWISIIVIAAIAVSAYLGIRFAGMGMRQSGNGFYDRTDFRDMEITASLLLSGEDLDAIRNTEGVADAEGVYYTTGSAGSAEKTLDVNAVSLTERINIPIAVEGRLPENADECAVEEYIAGELGINVGDSLSVTDKEGGIPSYLLKSDYKVTGIVQHPDHIAKPAQTPGNRYVLLTKEAFDTVKSDGCFMRAEVRLNGTDGLDRFENAYFSAIRETSERLETLAALRETARTDEIREKYRKDINENQKKLDDAKKELEESRKKLDDGKKQLDEAQAQLDDTSKELEAYKSSLDQRLNDIEHTDVQERTEEQLYFSGTLYDAGIADYNKGRSELLEKQKQLDEKRAALEDGEKEYRDGTEKYEDAAAEISKAQDELAAMKDCRWFLFNVRGNQGYAHIASSSGSISSLSLTFSLFFVVIAALIIYTSVGRIMEEQRKLLGTAKALGLYNREILAKYMIFGVGATIFGILSGIAAGYFLIQNVVLSSYKNMYVIGAISPAVDLSLIVIIIASGLLLSAAAVTLSCAKLMRSSATQLMQDKEPVGANRRNGKRRSGKNLYTRLIFRNMRSDLPRVIVTAVSVAGCCSLLVTGFTMHSGISSIAGIEYGSIIKYEEKIGFNSDKAPDAEKQIVDILKEAGADYAVVSDMFHIFRGGDELNSCELFSGDLNEFSDFYVMNDVDTGKPLPNDLHGLYIQSRTAEVFGLAAGDSIVIYDTDMQPCTMTVAGVFNNYLGYNMTVTDEYYREIFGKDPGRNVFLLRLNGADRNEVLGKLEKVSGFEYMKACQEDINTMGRVAGIFAGLAVMMIVIAGLMAYFILLNINKMYISRKTRELTIMRINGFTVREVRRYVLLETVFTTIAGILLGTGIGSAMGYSVIRSIETPYLMFVREPNISAWLLAAAITVIFTFGINAIALRKIKRLKLTDISTG